MQLNFNEVLARFFPNKTRANLWEKYNLYRAMETYNGQTISKQDALELIAKQSTVFAFPDPLPAVHLGLEPVSQVITTHELIDECGCYGMHIACQGKSILALCPIYVVASDYSWLIALNRNSSRNTNCILLKSAAEKLEICSDSCLAEGKYVNNATVVYTTIETFFKYHSGSDLVKCRPHQMLWDIPCNDNIEIQNIPPNEVVEELALYEELFVFPEPIPALFMEIEPLCKRISGPELVKNSEKWVAAPGLRNNCLLEIEPLYVVAPDYKWLICLTTENTQAGGTWCIKLKSRGTVCVSPVEK